MRMLLGVLDAPIHEPLVDLGVGAAPRAGHEQAAANVTHLLLHLPLCCPACNVDPQYHAISIAYRADRRATHAPSNTRGSRTAPGERDSAQSQRIFCPGGARPPTQAMIAFINEHRDIYGVEPICKVLPIAPSTYRLHAARQRDPSLLPDRTRRDLVMMEGDQARLRDELLGLWCLQGLAAPATARRPGRGPLQDVARSRTWPLQDVARCTVERLMRDLGGGIDAGTSFAVGCHVMCVGGSDSGVRRGTCGHVSEGASLVWH